MVRALGFATLAAALLAHAAPQDKDREKLRKALEYARKIDSALKGRKDASPPASDAEFLRRVHLDLVGTIPTLAETRAFLEDGSPTKRQDLIEKLLASEAHADLWARQWCFVLFGNYYEIRANVGGKNVSPRAIRRAFEEFRKWFRDHLAKDTPWSAIVAELVQATGKLSANPVLLYKTSFYYEGDASLNGADGMSKSLLGMRISCARCHDHPFDRWTQEDYYGLAAFLVRMKGMASSGGGMMMKPDNDNETVDVEFVEEPKGELTMPMTSKVLKPKFLFGGVAGSTEARLPALARFMVMRENSQLPRNVVNRTWSWLMGRGFVEPVDDFHMQNKPVFGSLLEDLTRGFTANGASIRFLLRAICNSEAYQRSCAGDATEPFATAAIRQLTGEQLFKSLVTACTGGDAPDWTAKAVRDAWGDFLNQVRPLYGADGEWTEVTPLPGNTRQALLLRNGGFVENLVKADWGLSGKVRAMSGSPGERISRIFLAVLVRPPTEPELARYAAFVNGQGGSREAYEDVIWTLVNSAEFVTRH